MLVFEEREKNGAHGEKHEGVIKSFIHYIFLVFLYIDCLVISLSVWYVVMCCILSYY